jgi:hypothetical protein
VSKFPGAAVHLIVPGDGRIPTLADRRVSKCGPASPAVPGRPGDG